MIVLYEVPEPTPPYYLDVIYEASHYRSRECKRVREMERVDLDRLKEGGKKWKKIRFVNAEKNKKTLNIFFRTSFSLTHFKT